MDFFGGYVSFQEGRCSMNFSRLLTNSILSLLATDKATQKKTVAAWMWLQALGEDIHGQRKQFWATHVTSRNQSRISRLKSNHKTPWMSLSPCLEDQVYLPLWGTAGLGYLHASVSISAQDKFVITNNYIGELWFSVWTS